jgi:osmotically inducible lipoprotein OsmB
MAGNNPSKEESVMSKPNLTNLFIVGLAALSLAGCQNIPASKGTQGAVVGGVGGATVGALVGGEHHRLLGALLGGALGSAGGYVVGANSDRILGHDQSGAEAAARRSQEHPATPAEALRAPTADLNGDGFVTMDEIVAMRNAGFSDAQMLQRLQATGQVFELTPDQRQYLLSQGVSPYVVDQMENLNRSTREQLLNQPAYTPYPANAPIATPPEVTPQVANPVLNQPPEIAAPPGVGQPPIVPPRY